MYVQFTSCVYGARPKISQMNFPFPSSPPQKLREELIFDSTRLFDREIPENLEIDIRIKLYDRINFL